MPDFRGNYRGLQNENDCSQPGGLLPGGRAADLPTAGKEAGRRAGAGLRADGGAAL